VFVLREDISLNVGHFAGVKASDVNLWSGLAMSSLHTNLKRIYIIIELTRVYNLVFKALIVLLEELFLEGDLMVVTLVTLTSFWWHNFAYIASMGGGRSGIHLVGESVFDGLPGNSQQIDKLRCETQCAL